MMDYITGLDRWDRAVLEEDWVWIRLAPPGRLKQEHACLLLLHLRSFLLTCRHVPMPSQCVHGLRCIQLKR